MLGQRLRGARRIPLALVQGCAPALRGERSGRSAGSGGSREAGGTVFAHVQSINSGRERAGESLLELEGRHDLAFLFGGGREDSPGLVWHFPSLSTRVCLGPTSKPHFKHAVGARHPCYSAGRRQASGLTAAAEAAAAREFEKRHPLPLHTLNRGHSPFPK